MKKITTLITACICAIASNAQTMTIGECIAAGISCNLGVENARIGIKKGHTTVSQSRARLLPTIYGIAQMTGYLKSPVNVTTGTLLGSDFPDDPTWQTIKSTRYNSNAGIQLTMPIYNQTLTAAIGVARTLEAICSLTYEKAVEDLTVQIGKVYYMAQVSREQIRLTDLNIDRMDELCEITEALYEQGLVMEVDLNRVRINRKMLKSEREVQHTLHEQQLNMLRFIMDKPAGTPIEVTALNDSIIPLSPDAATSQLPELLLAEKQKELIERRIKTVRAGFLPSLSLTGYAGGVGYNEKMSQIADHWRGNCHIGVTLRIPLFEARSKSMQLRQYRHEATQAANSAELLRKQIDKDYANATLQMSRNMEIAHTHEECRRQAEDVYGVPEEQYKSCIASMTSLLHDDMQLRTAQSAHLQAIGQCKLAQLDLLKLSGRLDLLSEQ